MLASRQFRRRVACIAALVLPLAAVAAVPPVPPGVSFDAVTSLAAGQPTAVLRYGNAPSQFAELWLPPGKQSAPLLVFVHGGCWLNAFGVDHSRPLASALTAAGYGVFSIEYRRVGDPGGGWPGSLEDIQAALRQLLTDAPAGLDLERVVLAGHSAGGHLVLLAAAELAAQPLSGLGVRGVLGLAPIIDIVAYSGGDGSCNRAAKEFMGAAPELAPQAWEQANPVARAPHAGTVILLGRDDAIVPYRIPGLDPHTLVGEPAGHFDWIHPGTPAWRRLLRELEQLLL